MCAPLEEYYLVCLQYSEYTLGHCLFDALEILLYSMYTYLELT